MAALESPLESLLASNYLSFEFLTSVHTVWTLVAVITTAVVSIWRIRASSPRGCCTDQQSHLACYPSSQPPMVPSLPVTDSGFESESQPLTASPAFDSLGGTSGKFALYYHKYEDDDVNNSNDGGGGGNEGDDVEMLHWVTDSCEGIMNIRMGDMDWYTYQDLKVLDGSVVQLWDGSGRRIRAAAPVAKCDGQIQMRRSNFSQFDQFYM